MAAPTIRGINEARLTPEEHNALAILRHLSIDHLKSLKGLMGLGEPEVIGPQTLATFRQLCRLHGFDLSADGVNAFKDSHQLGNTGTLRGVIGKQTAGVYFDELLKKVSSAERSQQAKRIFGITGAFEGRGFTNLTGNFDKQGISFGFLQWNFGQGSLPPLLKRMNGRDPGKFREILGSDTDGFLAILDGSRAAQLEFARSLNDSRNRVKEPWRTRFVRLGEYPPFQDVQVEFGTTLLNNARKLARAHGLKTERGLALMFDVVVQNGSIRPATREKIVRERTKQERAFGRSLTEREFMEIIAVEVAGASKPQYREDVLSRKLCIVRGIGRVHGRSLNLEAEFGLTDAAWA